jgi:hypothetical protein
LILTNYSEIKALINDSEILDCLKVYIGETFRKHIGGKRYIDLKNKKNAYYAGFDKYGIQRRAIYSFNDICNCMHP